MGALGYKMDMGRAPFSDKDGQEILEKHVAEQPVMYLNLAIVVAVVTLVVGIVVGRMIS